MAASFLFRSFIKSARLSVIPAEAGLPVIPLLLSVIPDPSAESGIQVLNFSVIPANAGIQMIGKRTGFPVPAEVSVPGMTALCWAVSLPPAPARFGALGVLLLSLQKTSMLRQNHAPRLAHGALARAVCLRAPVSKSGFQVWC